jgi:hypothetical protein
MARVQPRSGGRRSECISSTRSRRILRNRRCLGAVIRIVIAVLCVTSPVLTLDAFAAPVKTSAPALAISLDAALPAAPTVGASATPTAAEGVLRGPTRSSTATAASTPPRLTSSATATPTPSSTPLLDSPLVPPWESRAKAIAGDRRPASHVGTTQVTTSTSSRTRSPTTSTGGTLSLATSLVTSSSTATDLSWGWQLRRTIG